MRRFTWVAAAAALLLATWARPALRAQDTSKRPVNDRLFAAAAGVAGLAEVSCSRLAEARAKDEAIRKFARQMIEDHTKANQELTSLASGKAIVLPTTLDLKDQAAVDRLDGLRGDDFDRCYAKQQYGAHMEALALFEAEAERGQDRDLKAWASKTLPTLKEHLKTIKQICEGHEKGESKSESK